MFPLPYRFQILGIVALLLGHSAAAFGDILYSEDFRTAATRPAPIHDYNWNVSYGPSASTYDEAGQSGCSVAGNPGPSGESGYLSGGATLTAGQPVLFWIETGTFGSIDQLESITFALKNSSMKENIRVALRIDGNWYASDVTFNANDWATQTLAPSGTTWRSLSFVPGTTLSLGDVVTLPGTGKISALGFFSEAQVNQIRLDAVVVNSVPVTPGK